MVIPGETLLRHLNKNQQLCAARLPWAGRISQQPGLHLFPSKSNFSLPTGESTDISHE